MRLLLEETQASRPPFSPFLAPGNKVKTSSQGLWFFKNPSIWGETQMQVPEKFLAAVENKF